MDEPIQDIQDKYANLFKDQVHTPPSDVSGRGAVLQDILVISDKIMQWRESRALTIGGPEKAADTQRMLLQKESEIGARVFGLVKPGEQRSFFCFDRHTWMWYETWLNPNTRQPVSQTMRYEVSDAGVAKSSQVVRYQMLEGRELENFYNAVKVYSLLVEQQLYQ
ncbi:MAG: hypothetical protein ACOX0Z_04275 [Candidatus Nanosyncoccaceae bacterium]|jgi:hypothetical protein